MHVARGLTAPIWVLDELGRKIKRDVHLRDASGSPGATRLHHYGNISIGVPAVVAAQISSISALLTAMQPSVQSSIRLAV